MSPQEIGCQFNNSMKLHLHCILWMWGPGIEYSENGASFRCAALFTFADFLEQRFANHILFSPQTCVLNGISAFVSSNQMPFFSPPTKPTPTIPCRTYSLQICSCPQHYCIHCILMTADNLFFMCSIDM